MEVQGKIIAIHKEEVVSDKFKKRNIWIETIEQYPQTLEFQFVQDKTEILNNYKKDDVVEIGFNLRGRGWRNDKGEAKVFNTLQGWKINKVEANQPEPTQQQPQPTIGDVIDDSDSLPF